MLQIRADSETTSVGMAPRLHVSLVGLQGYYIQQIKPAAFFEKEDGIVLNFDEACTTSSAPTEHANAIDELQGIVANISAGRSIKRSAELYDFAREALERRKSQPAEKLADWTARVARNVADADD